MARRPRDYATVGVVTAIGLNWAVVLLLGAFGGRALDARLHTSPLFLVIGLFLGMVAGMAGSFQIASRYLWNKDEPP